MKKSFKTILSLILVLCMFVSIPLSASAATFVSSKSYVIDGNSQSGTVATMALWTADTQYVYFNTTNRTAHTKGTATKYTYVMTEIVRYSASESITQTYTNALTSLAKDLKVANSATAEVRLGEHCTIAASLPTGNYAFRAEFTCYKVVEEVKKSTTTENTVIWRNTIDSAPSSNSGTVRPYKL